MATNNQDIQVRIKTALDASQTETNLRKLNQLMREMISLGEEVGTTDVEAFEKLNKAVTDVEGKIGDTKDRLSTLSGEPLERVSAGAGLLGQSLSNLDFKKASIGISGMADGIKNMKLSNMKEELGGLISSFKDLGSALLTNPIFILGGILVALIANFDKLAEMGGVVGKAFKGIGQVITDIKNAVIDFSDSIGLTDIRTRQLRKQIQGLTDDQRALTEARIQGEISVDEVTNKSTAVKQYQLLGLAVDDAYSKYKKSIETLLIQFPELLDATKATTLTEAQEMIKRSKAFSKMTEEQKNSLAEYFVKREAQTIFYNKKLAEANETARLNELDAQQTTLEAQGESVDKHLKLNLIAQERASIIKKRQDKKEVDDIKQTSEEISKEEQNKWYDLYNQRLNYEIKIEELNKESYRLQEEFDNKIYIDGEDVDRENDKRRIASIKEEIKDTKKKSEDILNIMGSTYDKSVSIANDGTKLSDKLTKAQIVENAAIEKKASNERLKMIRESDLEALQLKQKNAKEDFDFQNNINELNYNQLKISYDEYLNKKKDLLKEYTEAENKRIADVYDKQIQLAGNNKNLIESLELSKKNAIVGNVMSMNKTIKGIEDDGTKHREDLLKEDDKLTKDEINLINQYTDTNIASNQVDKDIANSKLAMLDTLASKYQIHYGQKIELLQQANDAEWQINEDNRAKELSATDKTADNIARINKKYDELQIKSANDLAVAKQAAAKETVEKITQYTKYGYDVAAGMADLADAIDESKRDKDGKLALDLQKKKFERNKALQYGNAIMNTAAGIAAAIADDNWVGAAAAAVTGGLQIAKIDHTYFKPESAGSSGGSSGSGSITAPTMASAPGSPFMGQGFLGKQFNPNAPNQGYRTGSGSQQVYVLEQDITAMQSKVNVQQQRSTLSGL